MSSTDPEYTLKLMGASVKKSGYKMLALSIGMCIQPPDEAPPTWSLLVPEWAVSQKKVSEWRQRVAVGGNELIMSLEDSNNLEI